MDGKHPPDDRYRDPDRIMPSEFVIAQARAGRITWREALAFLAKHHHGIDVTEIAAGLATHRTTVHRDLTACACRLQEIHATHGV